MASQSAAAPGFEIIPPNPPNDGILFVDHSLANRSIVFGSNAKLTILPRLEEGRSAHLFNDGASSVLIHHGDTIAVQRARQKTTVVRMKPDSFYSTMRIKLREF